LYTATHQLLDQLMDVERAELQRMQSSAIVDSLVARRLQRGLDLLRLRDRICYQGRIPVTVLGFEQTFTS
jgi:hypothetical protein